MSAKIIQKTALEDVGVSLKLKLASLWASFMFLYIYVDYFHLYMPGALGDIIEGRVFLFEITQSFLVAGLVSVTIPALMIFLSIALPAQVNRWANMVLATIYIPYTLFNLSGEAWIHMIIGAIVEVAILSIVICYSWNWPRSKI